MDATARSILHALSRLGASLVLDETPNLILALPAQSDADEVLSSLRRHKTEVVEAVLAFQRAMPLPDTLHALPTDRRRTPRSAVAKGMVACRLAADTSTALKTFSVQCDRSIDSVLAAALAAFISRYSGETSLLLGCWAPASDAERGSLSIREYSLVDDTGLDGLTRMPESALPDPSSLACVWMTHAEQGYHPYFQILLTVEPEGAFVGHGQYPWCELLDLNIHVRLHEGGCDFGWEYSTGLFHAHTVHRMAENFACFLEQALQHPSRSLQSLNLISPLERRQLAAVAPTHEPFHHATTIHALFERQVQLTPDAVAVCHGAHRITYGQLDRAANKLAQRLRGFGIGADQFVGIYLGRTPALICSILAVLKSGAAYLPLDPTYPADRIDYLLQDACVPVVITDALLGSRFGGDEPCTFRWQPDELYSLESRELQHIHDDDAASLPEVDPEHLAYAIYTSGSTGQPKGVMIEHRNAACFLRWTHSTFPLADMCNVLASTSMNFDLSVFEFFGPLTCGGRLTLVDSLLDLLGESSRFDDVTLINSVPSAVNELVLSGRIPDSVRVVNLAGEPLRRSLVDRIYANSRVESVYNLYGPSEDTTYSTYTRVERGSQDEPTIGVPLSHTQAYILDGRLAPVPMGVVGELYLGGASLSRGYLNKPELTHKVFVPNPFWVDGDPPIYARLYRTGDRARWLPDGHIEFLGRVDHQVKIRGFRIELGEVEARLLRLPEVRECVVIVHRLSEADQRIVAYVAPGEVEKVDDPAFRAGLRASLSEFLPHYMLPASFMALAALPLLPNGKVNRKALPEPVYGGSSVHGESTTPTQRGLAELWAAILGCTSPPSPEDTFFGLGGHSLLLARLLNSIGQEFGVRLPFALAYGNPDLRAMALAIDEAPSRGETIQKAGPACVPHPGSDDQGDTLSFPQQQLWFIDQLQGASPQYHLQLNFEIRGPLSAPALERAIQSVLQRHETLRTQYRIVDGEPRQFVGAQATVQLVQSDLSHLPEPEREQRWLALLDDAISRPIRLDLDPMLRAVAVKLEAERHHLLLVVHHIAADGWSLELIKRDLSAFYAVESGAGATDPAPLPLRFGDYVRWEREQPQSRTAELVEYWRQQLSGIPVLHGLPLDRERPAQQSFRGGLWRHTLSTHTVDAFRRLCVQANTTLFVGLHALLAALVHRLSGDRDIVIGTPVAGRSDEALASLVGFFVNTLPLRCNVTASDSFGELLRRSRGVLGEAFEHQAVSFAQLTEAIAPQRSLGHSPIFQIMLSLQNNDRHALELASATVTETPPKVFSTCMFDLLIDVAELEDALHLAWEYNSDVFDESTVSEFAVSFEALLGCVMAQPDVAIGTFVLPTSGEQDLLLRQLNDTDNGFDATQQLHRAFECQAVRTPDATAVRHGSASLGYRELDQSASAMAARLRLAGVIEGDMVGVHLHRSLDMVASVLAVLKVGAVYVPLDTRWAEARLEHVITDSAMCFAISHRSAAQRLHGADILLVEIDDTAPEYRDGSPAVGAEVEGVPESDAGSIRSGDVDAIACVIYTDGANGTPKGVMIAHRNAGCFLDWAGRTYEARQLRSVLASTPLCSAPSLFELFAPLQAGGEVVLVDHLLDLASMQGDVDVTLINCTPSAMAELIGRGPLPPSVNTVNLTGEALPRRLVEAIHNHPGVEFVYNLYGIAEGTVYGTCARIHREQTTAPSIGRPISNMRAYVLDAERRLCPVGSTGELYLGGACLARGYLNQPASSERAFVPNPLLDRDGQGDIGGRYDSLFRTDDLARLRADGMLEFVGRADRQVVLGSLRFGLDEFEAVLAQHPDVRQAAALLDAPVQGSPRLVGYVSTRLPPARHHELERALRAHLRERLPHALQSAALVVLQALPLAADGRLDRNRLPKASHDACIQPQQLTPSEEALAHLWREVLKREESVGPGDNFFALGGHSLLLTRLLGEVKQRFDVRLSMKDVYESVDLSEMSRRITQAIGSDDGMPMADRSVAFPLSYSQLRVWFVEQLDPGTNQNNIQVGVRIEGDVSLIHLQHSLDEMVATYDAFRLQPVKGAGEPSQRLLAAPLDAPIRFHDLSAAQDPASEARALLDAHGTQVLDLYHAPLFSVMLLKLGLQEFRLNIVVHHLIFDGISFNAFLAELLARYDAVREGNPYPAPALTYDYADYVLWQRRWLQSAQAEQQAVFWREYLAQPPERVRLPMPVEEVEHAPAGLAGAKLDGALRERLSLIAQRHHGTLFNVMHSAFCLLLGRLSGSTRICTGVPVAGRSLAHSDRIYGNFLNNLPVQASFDACEPFDVYLGRQVKETTRLLAHQEFPFERIVEVNPNARDESAPLFNVFFNMLTEDGEAAGTRDFELHADDVGVVDTKFDLTLYVIGGGADWDLHCHHRTAFATPATVQRMIRQYLQLLRGIASDSALACGAYPLDEQSVAPEDHGIRAFWPGPVHALFEKIVVQHGDSAAVIDRDRTFSYRQLFDAAAHVSAQLRAHGVCKGSRVAVVATRSAELVAAVFAILRLGAAFSLLNPDQPQARVVQLLDILDPGCALFCGPPEAFDENLRTSLAGRTTCSFIDREVFAIAPLVEQPEAEAVDPQQPACITFTSGTSGIPKAVVGTHIGLAGYLAWWPAHMGVGAQDRYSLLSGLAHDPIQRDIFGALCIGAVLVIPDEAELVPGRLAAWFGRNAVSVTHLTPALSQILCDTKESLPALKLVFLTGEKLHSERVYALKRLNPDVVVLNSYGTTETQRGSTYFVASELSTYRGTVPLGRSTPDTRLRIFNANGGECSLGEVGEIYLESHHLSNGYLHDQIATERVLSVDASGYKRYRTGDQGCYLSDTLVRCLGRKDRQINIRGYRADLSEVESACRRDAAVKDAVVVTQIHADEADSVQLVAYVVTEQPSAACNERVMAQLRTTLPSFLVPAAVVSLSALPLTGNGKLDESRLPVPQLACGDADALPGDAVEQRVAAIWREILGREQVGATTSFFALGGHSLSALRMSGAIWEVFGVSLPLKSLFERPTIRAISEYIRMRPAEPEVLAQVVRTDRSEAALSFAQQRIHFLSQFAEQRSLFNLPRAFTVLGALDIEALKAAFSRMVERHSSLRTRMVYRDGDVVQQVVADCCMALEIVNLSELDPIERGHAADRLANEEAAAAFDLTEDLKLRAKLLVLGPQEHVLLLTLHHIASDGWSNGIVLSELSRHYAAIRQPLPAEPEELPALQYIDYSIWQRERHQQGGFGGSLVYWQAQLAGLPALHSLPTDRTRPARQSFAGAHLESVIHGGTLAGLRNVCRDSGATLFMALSAAWSIVQARFSGVDDIVVGTPVAGRDNAGLERTVGCFINNLVLRFDVGGGPSFLDYLAQVRQTALEAYSHADLPFEMLVEALNPVRTSSHPPLFQVLLALQNYEESPLSLEGTRCEPRMQDYPYSKFDLSLYCRERADRVDVLWEYSTALFDEATVQRMSRAFAVVLEAIAREPSTALDRLPLVDAPEQQRLMALARGPVVRRPEEPVHVWFQERCEQAPQRRALVAEDAVLSYGELNARANRIAHLLSDRIPKPAAVIGVCLDRSSSLVAALLGVLKSGACYVPLDPTQPAARLHAMATQAQVDAILTDERHAGLFTALEHRTAIVPLDSTTVSGELAAASSSNPDLVSRADDRAYIIFTSGSTGVPKGVTIGHAALGNLLLSMAEAPGMSEQDRLLAVTSIGFDIAGLEIFLPLVSGAELHLADAATCRDVARLAASLERQDITVMQATPSLWQLLADSGALDGAATGLKMLVGGEALTDALAARLCAIGSSVWNLYGPTETTIWSTRWQCSAGQAVSIGAPIENTECYVLSPALQLQPRGAVGELYIGGDGLAAGYHGRSELTADVFIPHPFSPQGRLYRTGDLCRQAEDGRLYCLGRRDHQIKIRGFRVEPGEVEAALLQCDGIAAGVVTMGRNSAGDPCLLAHVTATEAMPVPAAVDPVSMDASGHAIIAQLSSLLPDYMIPSAVVYIPRMPLNVNGKVDRSALPVIAIGAKPQEHEAPETEMESRLASMWAEGLQVMHVGVTDNFFSLGGHSILAMRLLARINAEYGLSVPLFDFIEAPTVRALAAKMESLAELRRAQALVAEMDGAVEWGHEIIL